MSTHINAANKNDIAESILLPGDPLRAKFIAENFLDSPKCYNEIRGMLGYTGTYRGVPVSVQGTGMGMPSMGIYSWAVSYTHLLTSSQASGNFISKIHMSRRVDQVKNIFVSIF